MADQNVQLIESEEDKKKKAAQVQPGSAFAGGTTSPVGAPSAAPSAGQQARAAQQAGPTKGTGFTGVGRYLQANVGSRLGEQVAGRVAQTGQQAQTRLGQAVGQFGQQLGQQQQQLTAQQQAAQGALQRIAGIGGVPETKVGYSPKTFGLPLRDKFDKFNKDVLSYYTLNPPATPSELESPYNPLKSKFGRSPDEEAKYQEFYKNQEQQFLSSLNPEELSEYQKYKDFQKSISEARLNDIFKPDEKALYDLSTRSQKSSDLTPSQEEIAAYQAVAGGQYQAPTGLEDAAGIRSQAQLAAQLAKGTETTKGRMGLLQQVVGRGPQQYTKGKSALDALILGQSGGELAAARRASAGLERKLGTEERLAQEQARQFGSEVERAKGSLTGEATGLEKRTTSDIAARKEQYQKDIDKLVSDIKSQTEKGELSPETAAILSNYGIETGTRFYDKDFKDLATFLAKSKGPAEEITSTTKEEAARLDALKKLSGLGRSYSEEEKARIGTTIDPTKGLDIDKSAFEKSFLSPGKEKISNLIKGHMKDITSQDYYSGFTDRKPVDLSSAFDPETNTLDEKAIQSAIDKYNQDAADYAWARRTNRPDLAPSAKYAKQLQDVLNYYRSGKIIKSLPGPKEAMEEKFSRAPSYSATAPGVAQFGKKKK